MLKKLLTKILKPLAKSIAKKVVMSEGDRLQLEAKSALLTSGPAALDGVFDSYQARIKSLLDKLKSDRKWMVWLSPVLDRIKDAVQEHGDALQERVKKEISGRGAEGLDVVFDRAQILLVERIDML